MNKTNTIKASVHAKPAKISNMLINIHSDKLNKITNRSPVQIRIYSNFNNKNQTITNIKNEIVKLYPTVQINNIFTNNNNIQFVNVQRDINNNIKGFEIYIT
jgi:hypothetical protein